MNPRFGFTTEQVEPEPWDDDVKPGWKVYLPHQCDTWRIDTDSAYDAPSDLETALARLDAFIAEAEQARQILVAAQGAQQPAT